MSEPDTKLKNLFKQLDSQEANPDLAWLKSTRQNLQAHIKSSSQAQIEHFKPSRSFGQSFLFKPAAVIATVLVLLGAGTTLAAQGAEPGETLYPLKLASEQAVLSVALSPGARAELYMKYADRRMGELEKLYTKKPGENHWPETVVQHLGQQMVAARDHLASLDDMAKYAEVALRFELLTETHEQRLARLEEKLNTTTVIIINRAQSQNQQNQTRALEALEQARAILAGQQQIHELLMRRLQARLDFLRARQEQLRNRLPRGLEAIQVDTAVGAGEQSSAGDNKLRLEATVGPDSGSDTQTEQYGQATSSEGVYFESELEIESQGSKNVDTGVEFNDGQVIINSRLQATGTSIEIREHSAIYASSSQSIRINGEEMEIE